MLALSAACGSDSKPSVPLAPGSPWPKFRADARQTGRADVKPSTTGGALWSFHTSKGIFSTPVIGADGTIYVGSADRTFYAINPDGSERWSFPTGEIIDSSALLDDLGRVYFASGDGHMYALDAQTGALVWTFAADAPGPRSIINWFEGNIAIGPDGTLYAGNDNFSVYGVHRDGTVAWRALVPDQVWSLPAVDPETGDLFVGNNSLLAGLGSNLGSLAADGTERWSQRVWNGSIAASPLLTEDGLLVVGSFDGFVRAFDAASGEFRWELGTRDHIYASPAELPDGTLVQPSADGTIYALDPATGGVRWAFDTLEPVRSSPAIDADGHVYVGSGEGKLFVLNPDGTLRWSMHLIEDDRNDLNASPALGKDAIYIAGESGDVFSVPYDYCLRADGQADPRCAVGGEALPDDGAFLWYTTPLGAPVAEPPASIDANQAITLSLFVRQAGETVLAHLDSASVEVTVEPAVAFRADVSSDRRFVVITPVGQYSGDSVAIRVRGQYLVNPERDGLKFTGGTPGGSFDERLVFTIAAPTQDPAPLVAPGSPGDPGSVLELYRMAAPLPSILPSYNQIGFDSLHYLIGAVEGSGDKMVAWVVGAKLAEGENVTVTDPATRGLFAVEVSYKDGLLTLENQAGFSLEAMGAQLTFSQFRLSARLGASGQIVGTPQLVISSVCSDISLYGPFLGIMGLCNPQTDLLLVSGATLLRPHQGGTQTAPGGVGTVQFGKDGSKLVATLTGSSLRPEEHVLGLLLVDAATGKPVSLDYGLVTSRTTAADGTIATVAVDLRGDEPKALRAYLMIDTYPAAKATVDLSAP